MNDQSTITRLKKIQIFHNAINSLLRKEPLTARQEKLLLSSAILLVENYSRDARNTQSLDFAYWIILNYSLNTQNMRPLFDFAFDFGLYPISKSIADSSKQDRSLIEELALDSIDELFSSAGIVSTLEQTNRNRSFMQHTTENVAYIAPTSFGKTRQLLERALSDLSGDRVCIVVPTKSLLSQTRNDIRELGLHYKLITHDEMYNGEKKFIAILTQERALRLLESNSNLSFTALFIDEAHRLFEKGTRALSLSRLIRICKMRNQGMPIAFLSPMVSDVSHFSAICGDEVGELRIRLNMKEPTYLHYRSDGTLCAYNRFFDESQPIARYSDIWGCIIDRATEKTLIYLSSPKKIQDAARQLVSKLPIVKQTDELLQTIKCLTEHVHESYDEIECLRHGVIYLHGKMPDGVKDYLVSKISALPEIKFVIANTVVLEGVNLPISSIAILSSMHLDKPSLFNLIGRASRLNRIFGPPPKLELLRPEVIFADSEWNPSNRRMINFIRYTRSSEFNDKIKNPLVKRTEGNSLTDEEIEIVQQEDFAIERHSDEFRQFKSMLYRMGFGEIYTLNDETVSVVKTNLKSKNANPDETLFNLIDQMFIKGLEESIKDNSFIRLKNEGTKNYYDGFLADRNTLPLSQRIARSIGVFANRVRKGDPLLFIGDGFGEVTVNGTSNGRLTYVDLSTKSVSELVSISMAKIKAEEDFLNNKITRFVRLLFEYKHIGEKMCNEFIYGTSDLEKIGLVRAGIPLPLVNFLATHGQLSNISIDQYGNLIGNADLAEFGANADDYIYFEIKKYAM